MINIPPKHSITGTTIFSVMSALAAKHDAINLSQGFPDFPIDDQLGHLLFEATQKGFNQYAPMPGLPMLRQAIAADIQNRYQVIVDADTEVTVTPGATYGIYTSFATILNQGDEVVVLEPAYDSYIPNIETCGAKAITVPLTAPTFTVDWDRVSAAITDKTKAIIVNTPHNPTGATWTKTDWDSLADVVRGTDIIVLSDEVYEQLSFDQHHYSVLQHEELRARSFAIYSFGKVFNNTGWKMGYVVAPLELTKSFRSIHQFLCFSVNTPAQYAIAQYLSAGNLPDVNGMMKAKRDYFLNLLKDTPFTVHQPAGGSYFQTVSYEKISDKGDMEFAQWLTEEHGVATIPVSAFYKNKQDDKIIRFCFAKQEATLDAAVDKLRSL